MIDVGTPLPTSTRSPTAVDLFMFSAASWLTHRIHYDVAFTTETDGHPALLIHGPLQGVYLVQHAGRWLGSGSRLSSVTWRHKAPAYLGETLTCEGEVVEADEAAGTMRIELRLVNEAGKVTTEGTATFEIGATGR